MKISSLFHHFCPICSINIVRIAGIVNFEILTVREEGIKRTDLIDQ